MLKLDDREKEIDRIASILLEKMGRGDSLDESTIDANFIFRFEPWQYRKLREFRLRMRTMVGEKGDGPLTGDVAAAWWVHLRSYNPAKYRILGDKLRASFNQEAEKAFKIGRNSEEFNKLAWKVQIENWQTGQLFDDIVHYSRMAGILPFDNEFKLYSPKDIEQMWVGIINWVVTGLDIQLPNFRWEHTRFQENKPGKGIERYIRIWQEINKPRNIRRMDYHTRTRTWAIYFLSKRGGGRFVEEKAIDLWNERFPSNSVEITNYKRERAKLFKQGSKKGIK